MKTTREKIEVMEAYERGEQIEYKPFQWDKGWRIESDPNWNWSQFDYRIKPKQKVRRWLWAYKGKSDSIWAQCLSFMTEDEAKYNFGFAEIIKIESSMIEVDE